MIWYYNNLSLVLIMDKIFQKQKRYSSKKNMKKLDRYDECFEYDYILEKTSNYNNIRDLSYGSYSIQIIYRIKALVTYGRFDEAEELCHEILSFNHPRETTAKVIYYYLFIIHYFKREYIKCLKMLPTIQTNNESYNKQLKYYLAASLAADGNPELKEKLFYFPKSNIITHFKKKRSHEINVDVDLLLDTIFENFNNTRVYYQNISELRVFRCFNIAKSDYNGKMETCEYILVYSRKDFPESIATFYFVSSVGSLESLDITNQIYKAKDTTENKNNICSATSKFMERQRKKKS